MKYDFEIVYGAGVKHQAAHMLFLLPASEVENTEWDENVPAMLVTGIENKTDMKAAVVSNQTQKNMSLP